MATRAPADEAPLPEIGTQVSIEGARAEALASLVAAREGRLIGLDRPRLGGRPVTIRVGQHARITFRARRVPCAFRVIATNTPGERDDDEIWFEQSGPVERHQRRMEFRVDDALQIRMWRSDGGEDDEPIPAVTENLSASGVLLRAEARCEVADSVQIVLQLPERGALAREARVVRVGQRSTETGERPIALTFTGRPDDAERLLRSHVLERQRAIRRRELGLA